MATMTLPHRFELDVVNASTALLRIIMVFSRRRITLDELHWHDRNTTGQAKLSVNVTCTPTQAAELHGQLGRIVEVALVRTIPEQAEAAA